MSARRSGRRVVGGALALLGIVAAWAPAAGARSRAPARPGSGATRAVAARAVPLRPITADLRVAPQRGQRIDGFGVSGGWWPANVGRFPAAAHRCT